MMAASRLSNPSEKLNNKKHINWIKLNLALFYGKTGIHNFIKTEIDSWHMKIRNSIYRGKTIKMCNICKSADIIWKDGTWKFVRKCYFDCEKWLLELIKFIPSSVDQNRIYWNNSDVRKWPYDSWECAKIFLPRGQQRSNTGPDMSDSQALMTLLANCTHFRSQLTRKSQILTCVISFSRNLVMHNPDLEVSDNDMIKGVQQIIEFLQVPIFKSFEECTEAIKNIQELQKADYQIVQKHENEAKLFYLEEQMSDMQKKMDEMNERNIIRFIQLENEIKSVRRLFEKSDNSEEMQINIQENIDTTLQDVRNAFDETRITTLENGLEKIKTIVDYLIKKDPDTQEGESAKSFVENLKRDTNWNPSSPEAVEHLVESAKKDKFVQCQLLLNEGVQMDIVHLPGIVLKGVSLRMLRVVIKHLKDIEKWDCKSRFACEALETSFEMNNTDLFDELTGERVTIEHGIEL